MRFSVLSLAVLVLAVAAASPALAAPDEAAPDGASSGALNAITVTARRRAEDAQSVPIALSVVGGDLLERSYTVNTQQLSQLVPTVSYSSANPRNTAFTIRGLGSNVVAVSQSNDGLEPGVGFYVDQVYHARPATAAFDFTDIERIEVLRGPQGTLFGKNTTAGAISISTRLPTFDPQAIEEISFGSKSFVQAKASASGPLFGDVVAFRLSGLSTRRDGVIDNVRTGADQNDIGNQAIRGQLLIVPSATFTLRLTADLTNFSSECCTQVTLRVGQSLRPLARQYAALASGYNNYTPPSTNPYDRVTDIDAQLGVRTSEGGVSAIADWSLGAATLTSISAWRFWNWDAANDRDYTGIPIQITQHIPSRQDQYSQELRIASNSDTPLRYVAGLYYFNQKITGQPISVYGPAAAYWLIGPTTGTGAAAGTPVPANLLDGYGSTGHTRFVTNSYAAFGELNTLLTPRLTVTGGLRYTIEKKAGDYALVAAGGLATTNAALLAAKAAILRSQVYAARNSEDNVSGRANLSWQATDDVMCYVSVARGFKSGGINMSGLPLDAANQPALSRAVVAPEKNTTYEIGVKSRLFDRRLVVNLAGFYTQVRDFQATIVDTGPTQTAALRGYLSNIPKVTVRGVEADATAFVTRDLSLRAAIAYADGKYADYPAGPCPLELQTSATTACRLTGQRLSGLSRIVATIGGDYALPVSSSSRVVVHADSNFRSGYFGDPSDSGFTWIKGYNVTNASIAYRSDAGWEVAVFARNLFQSNYIQNLTIQAGNSGLILGTPSDPRSVGFTFRAWQ